MRTTKKIVVRIFVYHVVMIENLTIIGTIIMVVAIGMIVMVITMTKTITVMMMATTEVPIAETLLIMTIAVILVVEQLFKSLMCLHL